MNRVDKRREEILFILASNSAPVSGGALSNSLGVSRQIIVQDISALRESGLDIISTNTGYLLMNNPLVKRVIKVSHTDEDIFDELEIIVKNGAHVEDVFVKHRAYGKIIVPLNIHNMEDIQKLIDNITSGVSRPLKNLTKSYHYHTISAKNKEILDNIEILLKEKGFLLENDESDEI